MVYQTFQIPIGTYKGKSVRIPQTTYLLWFLSQDSMRAKYPEMARALLAELHKRLHSSFAWEEAMLVPPSTRPPEDFSDLV